MKIRNLAHGSTRFLVAAAVAAALGGGAYAFAASLTVHTTKLGAGTVTVAATTKCAPTFTYTTAWTSTAHFYKVTTVTATANTKGTTCNAEMVRAAVELTGSTYQTLKPTAGVPYSGGTATVKATAAFTAMSPAINAATVIKIIASVDGTA